MPEPARAKRARRKQTARSVLADIAGSTANVEAPLSEAVDLLHALLVMGYGMIDNNGRREAGSGHDRRRLGATRCGARRVASGGRERATADGKIAARAFVKFTGAHPIPDFATLNSGYAC